MIESARYACKRFPRQLFARGRLLAALSMFVIVFFYSTKPISDPDERADLPGQEDIGIYILNGKEPTFLADVTPAEYSSNGSLHIHQAHVNGLTHSGAWIHILDRCGRGPLFPSLECTFPSLI